MDANVIFGILGCGGVAAIVLLIQKFFSGGYKVNIDKILKDNVKEEKEAEVSEEEYVEVDVEVNNKEKAVEEQTNKIEQIVKEAEEKEKKENQTIKQTTEAINDKWDEL